MISLKTPKTRPAAFIQKKIGLSRNQEDAFAFLKVSMVITLQKTSFLKQALCEEKKKKISHSFVSTEPGKKRLQKFTAKSFVE